MPGAVADDSDAQLVSELQQLGAVDNQRLPRFDDGTAALCRCRFSMVADRPWARRIRGPGRAWLP